MISLNEMIKLNDLLHLTEDQIGRTKIRFMVKSGDFDPIADADDSKGRDELNLKALTYNKKRIYFKTNTIAIGFINLGDDRWLMTGIVQVKKDQGEGKPASSEYLDKKFNFRLVVKHHKSCQNGIRNAKGFIDTLEVVELWNPDKSVADKSFPGYKEVTVGFHELKKKLDISEEWRRALRDRKGVYLITDKNNGKHYVGSAYGKNGIYGRWKVYVESGFDKDERENGKYPNKRLKEMVKKKGMKYVQKYFQYSILETFTDDVPDDYIIERESWWKEAIQSRKRGYNAN